MPMRCTHHGCLAGALSLGDIGKYFPPTDPKWKGADSLMLLEQVMGLVRERGWSVVNVDSVVIAERPKLKPHIEAMRAAIAERMGLAPEQVGVKATTNEKLGAEGREEGISCQAVALFPNHELVRRAVEPAAVGCPGLGDPTA